MNLAIVIIIIIGILILFGLYWARYRYKYEPKIDKSLETGFLRVIFGVDLEKYQGKWYEIARLPNVFEKSCTNPIAIYTLNDNGTMNVKNQCNIGGLTIDINGILKPEYPSLSVNRQIGSFYVDFENIPKSGEYKIIYIDPDYQYAMVGTTDRQKLWLLSRSYDIDDKNLSTMITIAKLYDFPVDKLVASNDSIARSIQKIITSTNFDARVKCFKYHLKKYLDDVRTQSNDIK